MRRSYDVVQCLRSALDERRRRLPRSRLPRGVGHYAADRILFRPLLAFAQLARLSEYLLSMSYAGKANGRDAAVVGFFDAVQREVKRLLEDFDPAALKGRDNTPEIRRRASELLSRAKTVLFLMGMQAEAEEPVKRPAAKRKRCPFCKGNGMSPQQIARFKYALLKMIRVGVLPESFKEFA